MAYLCEAVDSLTIAGACLIIKELLLSLDLLLGTADPGSAESAAYRGTHHVSFDRLDTPEIVTFNTLHVWLRKDTVYLWLVLEAWPFGNFFSPPRSIPSKAKVKAPKFFKLFTSRQKMLVPKKVCTNDSKSWLCTVCDLCTDEDHE